MTISRKNEQTERRAHKKIKRNLCKGLQRRQTDNQKDKQSNRVRYIYTYF